METDIADVLGTGRRPRGCPCGAKADQALDRYLRARTKHRRSHEQALCALTRDIAGRTGAGPPELSAH